MTQKDELLRLAKVLASSGEAPIWVARNRAVSTGYYALFHAFAELCARELVGAFRPWLPFRHVYRSLDHSQARQILDAVKKDGAASAEMKSIASLFVELQGWRHDADYDPGFRISSGELATLLDQIGDAIANLGGLAAVERKMLAARLVGRTRRSS